MLSRFHASAAASALLIFGATVAYAECTYTPDSLRSFPLDLSGKQADKPTEKPANQTGTGQADTDNNVAEKVAEALKRTFAYHPPGVLHPSDDRKGRIGDRRVYLPDIVYPLALGPGLHPHMNSQIYGNGGGGWNGRGKAGGIECSPANYNPMVQHDNYCEVRGWKLPLCPAGTGHQGQDIRPPTCADAKWEAVAVADGIITRVTSNTTVSLKGDDGTVYLYLHMHPNTIRVKKEDRVKQGQVLGKVSRIMGGRPATTTHLHFQAQQTIQDGDRVIKTWVPVYTSLIAAYRKAKGIDNSVDADGNLVKDWRYEIGVERPDEPLPPTPEKPDADQKPDEKPPQKDETPKPDETAPKDETPAANDQTPKPEDKDAGKAEEPKKPEEPDKPAGGTADNLADANKKIAELATALDDARIARQREIEAARGEADAAKGALETATANLAAAQARVAALQSELAAAQQKALDRETELQANLNLANDELIKAKAEVERMKREMEQAMWPRVQRWWKSVWD